MLEYLRRKQREHTLRKFALPDVLWNETLARIPFLACWPGQSLMKLRTLCTLFLVEKNIISGHPSLEVTSLMRTLIAAQACTLIVHRTLSDYAGFTTIVIHPDSFPRTEDFVDEAGVVHADYEPIAGEAWPDGPVLLSWPDVFDTIDFANSGTNLVIHEFAHKIDMQNGEANGVPPMETRLAHENWCEALASAYRDFCSRVDAGEETQIDPYASEHESEFFAVCAEVYAAEPHTLRAAYPAFFVEMNLYFKLWEEKA